MLISPIPQAPNPAFGNGSDGAVTFDGSTDYASFSSRSGSTYTLTFRLRDNDRGQQWRDRENGRQWADEHADRCPVQHHQQRHDQRRGC